MSPEAAVLGLLSAVRATPLAVVYALLLAPRPRPLLAGYVAAGMGVSLVAGLVIVATFDGSATSRDSSTTRYAIDAALGVAALAYAAGYGSGWIGRSSSTPSRERGGVAGAVLARLRRPTPASAALAGAVTNLPGLFYVAALVAILETTPGPVNGAVQVVVYNLLRFVLPIAALVLVALRPELTRSVTERARRWGVRNRRGLVTGVAAVVGLYLAAKGVSGLLG